MPRKITSLLLAAVLSVSCMFVPVKANGAVQEGPFGAEQTEEPDRSGTSEEAEDVEGAALEASFDVPEEAAPEEEMLQVWPDEEALDDIPPALYDNEDGAAPDTAAADMSEEQPDQSMAEEDIVMDIMSLPEASVDVYADQTDYIHAVSAMSSTYGSGEGSTLIINTADGSVMDGEGTALDRCGSAVEAAAGLGSANSAAYLEDSGYEVLDIDDDAVIVADPFGSARLLVTSRNGVDTSGAVCAISCGNEYVLQYATSGDAAQALERLSGSVDSIEVDIPMDVMDDDVICDIGLLTEDDIPLGGMSTASGTQGGFEGAEGYISWAVPYLGIEDVLSTYSDSTAQEVIVAVIDSGFDDVGQYFSSDRVLEPLTIASNGDTSDANAGRHGTFVVGQIYESTPSYVKILPVRAFNDAGELTVSGLISALKLVRDYGEHVSIVNMSIGTSGQMGVSYSGDVPDELIRSANASGTFFFAAAGNHQTSLKESYPAKSPYVYAVTAIDGNGEFASSFSNYGEEGYDVAYAAPGVDIGGISALDGGFTTISGTSMASPYTASCAAILMSQGKLGGCTTADEFQEELDKYVRQDLTGGDDTALYGAGCIGFPADISKADVVCKNYYYNGGAPVRPGNYTSSNGLVVAAGKDVLTKDVDYTVDYADNVLPGLATVTVAGKGLYSGSASASFRIYGKMEECGISPIGAQTYTGSPIEPVPDVTFHGIQLTPGTDYTVTYANNTEPGTATVLISGMGFYRNTASLTFEIVPQDLSAVEISPVEDCVYTGQEIVPSIMAVYNGMPLIEGTDYEVTDVSSRYPGEAVCTIQGIGPKYRGTASAAFRIVLGSPAFVSIDNEEKGLALTWRTVPACDGYIISRKVEGQEYEEAARIEGPQASAYTDQEVADGTIYEYRAAAYVVSDGQVLTSDYDAMSALRLGPPSISLSNGKKGVGVKWSAVDGADGYLVYRKDGRLSASGERVLVKRAAAGTTFWTDSSVTSGQYYTYEVVPCQGDKEGAVGRREVLRLDGTGCSLTNTDTGVKVKWNKVPGARGYRIYRKLSGQPYEQVGSTSASRLYYVDKTVPNGKGARYYVKAYDGQYSAPFLSSSYICRLAKATLKSVTSPKKGTLLVKWKKNSRATGYQVRYSRKSDFTNAVNIRVRDKATVTRTIRKLSPGKSYYVKVRAYKTVNGKNYYGPWSSSMKLKTRK